MKSSLIAAAAVLLLANVAQAYFSRPEPMQESATTALHPMARTCELVIRWVPGRPDIVDSGWKDYYPGHPTALCEPDKIAAATRFIQP